MESKNTGANTKRGETISICSQLNLDVGKLDDEQLLNNPTYLRLYNIIKNDMSRS